MVKMSTWMLDPASCAGTEIGASRASPAGLAALHEPLVGQGFRQSFPDDGTVSEEELDDVFACTSEVAGRSLTVRAALRLDAPTLRGLSPEERDAVVSAPAGLLLGSGGVVSHAI